MLSKQLKIVRQTRRQRTLLWKQSLDRRLLHQANILALNQTIHLLQLSVFSSVIPIFPALVLGMLCTVDPPFSIPYQFDNATVILSFLHLVISYSVVNGSILSKSINSKKEVGSTDILFTFEAIRNPPTVDFCSGFKNLRRAPPRRRLWTISIVGAMDSTVSIGKETAPFLPDSSDSAYVKVVTNG